MTVTKLLRPRSEEPVETGGLPVSDASNEQPISLMPSGAISHAKGVRPSSVATSGFREDAVSSVPRRPTGQPGLMRSERDNGTGRFTFTSHALTETGESRLHQSLDTLSKVVSSPDCGAGEWLDAAATLKRDAVRLRNSSQARHAAVLLTVADALIFTAPSRPTLDEGASRALQQALALLTNPFISQEAEENLVVELITLGWNLAPASNGQPLAS